MYGGCGSGSKQDCKLSDDEKVISSSVCCDNGDLTVGPDSKCGWKFGSYGDQLECNSDYIVSGYCGSPGSAACGTGAQMSYTGVYCCPYVDNKR